MRILVDENIPRMTVSGMCDLGHDVKDIRGTLAQGMPDSALWRLAMAEPRMVVTTDKGFTEHRGAAHFGILIVRLRQPNRLKIHRSVMLALRTFSDSEWPGLLIVMRDTTMSATRSSSSAND